MLRELSPLLWYSIALDIKFNRIKIHITQKAHTAIIQKYLFSIIPFPILETTWDFWMLSIDFSYRNPGWKIYWRVPIKQYLNLLPKDHENYIEHILIKEDISKILPWRNKKIYFKYSWLPNDDFFQRKFPIINSTWIIKPNYYAIQPENGEESLYYFISKNR